MRVHFIAIGGSAMHNLAIAMHRKGYQVSGSDDEIFEPSRSRLEKEGILPKNVGWRPEMITSDLDAIILGMHAKADNPELIQAQNLGLQIFSYPEFLYEQSKTKKRVVIGGSHGKTTITSMILHVLQEVGIEADYMVGAQLEGFDVMVRLTETAEWMIMEGDEYLTSPIDRRPKFLLYHPHIAVISGIGWDHVNVFPTFDSYLEQFRLFVKSIEQGGTLIYCETDPEVVKIVQIASVEKSGYGVHPAVIKGNKTFARCENGEIVSLNVFGSHNLSNLNAARLVCQKMGISADDFYKAISSFKGAARRLELLFESDKLHVFRDFAHAPSKLAASVAALKMQFPDHQLLVCFELHTYSSLSEQFIDHYKDSLEPADVAAVFYDPHAVAIKKLSLMEHVRIRKAFNKEDLIVLSDKASLLQFLKENNKRPLVTALMSSGSFNGLTKTDLEAIYD